MKTNSKLIKMQVYTHIKDAFEYLDYENCNTFEEKVKNQVDYMKFDYESAYKTCYRLAEGGTFLVSNYYIRQFIEGLNINNNSNKVYDDYDTCKLYFHLLARELETIYNGSK